MILDPLLPLIDLALDGRVAARVSVAQASILARYRDCREGRAPSTALGGYVTRCENATCGHTEIAYNSCRNRNCPKCQAAASRRWLADREAELLPVPAFHVVYTLPSELRDIAYHNKRVVYDLPMKAAAETTLAIADPKRLGARIGVTAVLHTWGSALTHHPHVHMIVPGGRFSLGRDDMKARVPKIFSRRDPQMTRKNKLQCGPFRLHWTHLAGQRKFSA